VPWLDTEPRCLPQLRKYQEQSHLLDPLLEDLVTPLASRLRSFADDGSNADLQGVQGLSHLLWAIVTVRCAAQVGGRAP